MELLIKKLSPELEDDYLEFFEYHAFDKESEFNGCYCTWYHWNDDLEKERSQCPVETRKCFKRELARKYISQGLLQGYLAYSEGKVVGWCNANDRENYDRMNRKNRPDLWVDSVADEKVKSIVCFIMSPEFRGNGIATVLLKAVCDDARENHYNYIEAYPALGPFSENNYHGPYSMYEKLGFVLLNRDTGETVVRRYL